MATHLNGSYSTPDYALQPTIPTGAVFARDYDFTKEMSSGDFLVLDTLPYFPLQACGGAMDLTAGGSSGALTLGYGTIASSTVTEVDPNFFANTVGATAAARAVLAPGYSTTDAARKPEGDYVLFVKCTGGTSVTFTGHVVVLMAG